MVANTILKISWKNIVTNTILEIWKNQVSNAILEIWKNKVTNTILKIAWVNQFTNAIVEISQKTKVADAKLKIKGNQNNKEKWKNKVSN